MSYEFIKTENRDGVLVLTMHDPPTRNALGPEMAAEVRAELDRFEDDPECRVLLVTGTAPSFCSGANVRNFNRSIQEAETADAGPEPLPWGRMEATLASRDNRIEFVGGAPLVPLRIHKLQKPSIAAVNGHAMGVGMGVALACDIRIAAEGAVFSEAFSRMGLIPGDGSCWQLPRLIGMSNTLLLQYTGDRIDGNEAYRLGIASRVVPDGELMESALELATRLAKGPTQSHALIKYLVHRSMDLGFEEALDLAHVAQVQARKTEDHKEPSRPSSKNAPRCSRGGRAAPGIRRQIASAARHNYLAKREGSMGTTQGRIATASSRDPLAVAGSLLPEIRGAADGIDEARRLPDWLAGRLAGLGLFHLLTGAEHGGLGADPVTAARVIETLSAASPSVGWVTMIIATASFWTVRVVPKEVRREIFADVAPGQIQPAVIAGTLVPHGRALRVEGGWRLSGQWPFGSGCHHATWLPSASWLHDDNGPITDESGVPQWRAFHLPASDCAILDTWYTSGLRGTGSTDYTMDGVFVPDIRVTRHSLLEPSVLPDRRYAYPAFNVPMLSAVALGTARGAVDSLTELFGGKVDRRNLRPVAAALDKQADLGIATATVDSARAYLYDTTSRAWDLIMAGEELPRELRAAMRLACTHAVTASVQAVDRAHSAAGASSIYSASPLNRYFRDVHSVAAHAFVRQTTMADGGLLLLGQEPAFRVF